MQKGTVKWFSNSKGYGFILPENQEGDLFAHYSAITMDGYKTLKAGQKVVFETMSGPKGMHAVNIRIEQGSSAPSDPANISRREASVGSDAGEEEKSQTPA